MPRLLAIICICLAPSLALSQERFVAAWVAAHGGCKSALGSLQSIKFGRVQSDRFLDKLLIDWTDAQVEEFRNVYAECYAIASTPPSIQPNPRNQNVLMFTSKRVEELRSVIGAARDEKNRQAVAVEARKKLAQDEARASEEKFTQQLLEDRSAVAKQSEEDEQQRIRIKRQTEQAESGRVARITAAKEHAKHEEEVAAEIERQAEAEEKALVETRKVSEAAQARRRAAEERLAQAKAASKAEEFRPDGKPTGRTRNSEDLALRLVTFAAFVDQGNCSRIKTNHYMLGGLIKKMEVDTERLSSGPRLVQAGILMNGFKDAGNAACEIGEEMFGPNGKTVAGIFDFK